MLKLQYFGHLMRRVNSLGKTLMLGNIEGRKEKGTTEDEMVGWHHQLNGPNKLQEIVKEREAWQTIVQGVHRVRHALTTE